MKVSAFFGLAPLVHIKGHVSGTQPLHWAAEHGHVEVREKFLSAGADVDNGQKDHAWTPLYMAGGVFWPGGCYGTPGEWEH